MTKRSLIAAATLGVCAISSLIPAFSKDETTGGKMSTSEKQDIINTLRNRGAFHKMLDGLEQAFDLDNELKGKGPYTVFAADDKAWAKINEADQNTLFGNKNKLSDVLKYEVVKGKCLDSEALCGMNSVQSLEGKMIKIASKDGEKKDSKDLWVNNSKIKDSIRCSNGIVHIVDAPLMPALVQ